MKTNVDHHCEGHGCHSKRDCKRYTDRKNGTAFAAFYARREADAMACDAFIANRPGLSTFDAPQPV